MAMAKRCQKYVKDCPNPALTCLNLIICNMSSIRFLMLPSNPLPPCEGKKRSYKSHPIFILGEITIFRVNPGHVCYFQIIVHGGSTGIFHQRAQARINGPVRPSVWDLCRFGMTRPEPRPTTFISGQETLASVAYQGGSRWSMVGKQLETYCDLVMLIGFKIMTFL